MSLAVVLMLLASLAAGASLMEVARIPPRPRRRPATAPTGHRPRWAARAGLDARTERMLDAAGRLDVPDAGALAARRRLGTVIGATWGGALGLLLAPGAAAVALALAGGAAGRGLPALLLIRAGRQRASTLADESPELLDLLAVAVACGLPLRGALLCVGSWGSGPLAVAAVRAAGELEHGAAVDPTLDRLVREHPISELEAAVAILRRAREHGTPAAAPLRALAAEARQARARRAMEHAARAAPRVQLVAALLLVPAALCVLAAAVVAGGLG